jgi:hypothetical protein
LANQNNTWYFKGILGLGNLKREKKKNAIYKNFTLTIFVGNLIVYGIKKTNCVQNIAIIKMQGRILERLWEEW